MFFIAQNARNQIRYCSSKRLYWNWIAHNFSSRTGKGSFIKRQNEVFLSIRNEGEMTDTLIASSKTPLVMNFTMRNNNACDKLTGALNRIIMLETDKIINCVDVEVDWTGTKEILTRFGVQEIPSLVAVRKGFPVDYYTQKQLVNEEVDWYALKSWIEKNADSQIGLIN